MSEILIKQAGRKCQVWYGGEKVFEGGRVMAKKRAVELYRAHGGRVFNIKDRGAKVDCTPEKGAES